METQLILSNTKISVSFSPVQFPSLLLSPQIPHLQIPAQTQHWVSKLKKNWENPKDCDSLNIPKAGTQQQKCQQIKVSVRSPAQLGIGWFKPEMFPFYSPAQLGPLPEGSKRDFPVPAAPHTSVPSTNPHLSIPVRADPSSNPAGIMFTKAQLNSQT